MILFKLFQHELSSSKISKDDLEFSSTHDQLINKHPITEDWFSLPDFRLYKIQIEHIWLISMFDCAYHMQTVHYYSSNDL